MVETERILIVRHAEEVVEWCPFCNRQETIILLDNAAFCEPILAAQIQSWRQSGRLHVWPQENGLTWICLASLLCCFELEENSGFRITKEVL
jgi:hypothetical protein